MYRHMTMGEKSMSISNYELHKTVINQFIITLGDYTCMYIHTGNKEIECVWFLLLLQQTASEPFLESCVLKLISELHDFI